MSVIIDLQMVKKKFGPKNWEFLEIFLFLEYFGMFLERAEEVEIV